MIKDKEKTITQEETNKKIKLDISYLNYCNIIDKKLPYKFSCLDDWLLKKSKLLTNEANILENNLNPSKEKIILNYKTYGRGTIVKTDFGIGIGSEISQIHFAIVLNNYDNPKNNILTVIPLTSKKGKFNINLGAIISTMFVEKIDKQIKQLASKKRNTINDIIKANKIGPLLEYYKTYIKITYACPSLITTISKEKIFPPVNEYDMMGKIKCAKSEMKIIDEALYDRFFTKD